MAEISNLLSWQNFKLQSSLVTVMVTIFYANLRGRVRVYDSINAFVVVKTTEEWGTKARLMNGERSRFPSISYKFKRTIINRVDNITEGKKTLVWCLPETLEKALLRKKCLNKCIETHYRRFISSAFSICRGNHLAHSFPASVASGR